MVPLSLLLGECDWVCPCIGEYRVVLVLVLGLYWLGSLCAIGYAVGSCLVRSSYWVVTILRGFDLSGLG